MRSRPPSMKIAGLATEITWTDSTTAEKKERGQWLTLGLHLEQST